MNEHNLSYWQVMQKIKTGKLPAVKNGREWYITTAGEVIIKKEKKPRKSRAKEVSKSTQDLKDQKLQVEIKKIQQQLESGRNAIIAEYKHDVITNIVEILAGLRIVLDSLHLPEKDLKKLSDTINAKIKQLTNESK
jgi:restriction endonuclease Mrr